MFIYVSLNSAAWASWRNKNINSESHLGATHLCYGRGRAAPARSRLNQGFVGASFFGSSAALAFFTSSFTSSAGITNGYTLVIGSSQCINLTPLKHYAISISGSHTTMNHAARCVDTCPNTACKNSTVCIENTPC